MSTVLKSHGFTNESLQWRAWLDTVDVSKASAEQIAVLEESHPTAKVSDYYLFLVHQPEILRQRSIAFNAIMYAPGGMSRAERELGATVVAHQWLRLLRLGTCTAVRTNGQATGCHCPGVRRPAHCGHQRT